MPDPGEDDGYLISHLVLGQVAVVFLEESSINLDRVQPSRALGLGRPKLTRRPGSVLREPAGVAQTIVRGHVPVARLSGYEPPGVTAAPDYLRWGRKEALMLRFR